MNEEPRAPTKVIPPDKCGYCGTEGPVNESRGFCEVCTLAWRSSRPAGWELASGISRIANLLLARMDRLEALLTNGAPVSKQTIDPLLIRGLEREMGRLVKKGEMRSWLCSGCRVKLYARTGDAAVGTMCLACRRRSERPTSQDSE